MKRVLLAGIAAAALVTASHTAIAADMSVRAPVMKAPPVAAVFSWAGAYAGLHAGYAWGDGDHVVTQDGFGFLQTLGLPVKIDGWLGGGQIGYNWQSGNYVFGLEADISAANIEGFNLTTPGDDGYETKVDWFGTVRGRWGYAIDRGLGYLTAGLAYGHIEATMGDLNGTSFAFRSASDSGTKFGWTVGAGLEYAFAPNWTARVEYLYVDLGKFGFNGNNPLNGAPVVAKIDTDFHVVRGAVNLRW